MYSFSALHGHGTSGDAWSQRHPDRMQAPHELAVIAEAVERGLAHPGHDPHRRHDVRGVGQLHADVRDAGTQRAHRERHHVQRATPHRAPANSSITRQAHLLRFAPVVRRSRILFSLRADKRSVLDPRDIVGIRPRQAAVRALSLRQSLKRARSRRASAPPGHTPPRTRHTTESRRVASAPPSPSTQASSRRC